ncbi:MAG: hypothetical protein J5858_11995 [Lentisphaeria bacterium]|nr:hypothetical protein [Lentisphaeria bacterium]
MKEKKKITDSTESQKRLFLRMKSPSAFGAARRFDSASFMNVPPEMARRDAAYSLFFNFFRNCDLSGKSAPERFRIYSSIRQILVLIEEKTEFILNADTIEKRNLENIGTLVFVRLLQKYFAALADLAGIHMDRDSLEQMPDLPAFEIFSNLPKTYPSCEDSLIAAVRSLLMQTYHYLLNEKVERCKRFSKSDSERYERAYSFYSDYYRELLDPQPNERKDFCNEF